MTKKEKIKIGVSLAASLGACALANSVLSPSVVNVKGGRIMKILAFFGMIAVAGAVGDIAGKQAEEMVDTFSELPGIVREIKDLKKK